MDSITLVFGFVSLVIVVVLIYSLFHVAHKIMRWGLILLLVLFVATSFFGINVLQDISNLQRDFPTTKKLVIVKDGDTLLTGFVSKLLDSTSVTSKIDEDDFSSYQKFYNFRDVDRIRGDYFKLILIDIESFENVRQVTLGTNILSGTKAREFLVGTNNLDRVVLHIIDKQGAQNILQNRELVKRNLEISNIETDEDVQMYLFAALFKEASEDKLFLINGFKEGSVLVYPETITFKLAKVLPKTLLSNIVTRFVNI